MTSPSLNEAKALLYQALASPLGIVISTDNAERAKGVLYRARAEDEDLSVISIRVSPVSPKTELWLIRGKASAKEDRAADRA